MNSGNPPDYFNDVFQQFSTYLVFIRNRRYENGFRCFKFVNENCSISLYPFKIQNLFEVSHTHVTTIYDPNYMLIKLADIKNSHYISEN